MTMHLHLASSCSSSGFPSLSGVLTLSVLTMHVGRWRLSMRMSCCRSSFSSSICAFRSELSISSLSDSCEKEGSVVRQVEITFTFGLCYSWRWRGSPFADNLSSPSSCFDIEQRPLCSSPVAVSSFLLPHLSTYPHMQKKL